jgi:thioredoxin reductase (NADPH)
VSGIQEERGRGQGRERLDWDVLTRWHRVDLTKYGSHVYVLVRRDELRASKIMAKRLVAHPKVTVLWNVSGSDSLFPFYPPFFSHTDLYATPTFLPLVS